MPWTIFEPLKIERLTVAIANLPASLSGLKLVQLSDIHYDKESITEEFLAETIEACNQENPDLVILTGDYVTDDPSPIKELAQRLKYLRHRYGIYACLGNHDLECPNSKTEITKALTNIGIKVLWNEGVFLFEQQLLIIGLADFWSKEFNPKSIMNQFPVEIPRLVLSHNPDTAEILRKWRVDLQLSGHTHGGQIAIPGIGPVPIILQRWREQTPKSLRSFIPFRKECARVIKHWEWAQGWHQIGKNQLYVNRGLGTYAPGRFCCPPELTVITLISQHY